MWAVLWSDVWSPIWPNLAVSAPCGSGGAVGQHTRLRARLTDELAKLRNTKETT